MPKNWLAGLRKKLLLIGVTPLLALGAISQFNRVEIIHLSDELSNALDIHSKLSELLGEMDASTHALGRWIWISYGMYGEAEAKNRFAHRASDEIQHFDKTRTAFHSIAQDPETKELIKIIDQEWSLARPAAEEAIHKLLEEESVNRQAAFEIMQKKLIPHLLPMTAQFQKMKLASAEAMAKRSTESKALAAHVIWLTSIIVIITTTILGVLVYRLTTHVPKSLAEVATKISKGANNVGTTVVELTSTSQDLMRSTTDQASALEQTAAAAQEIASMVKRSAELAKDADHTSQDSRQYAENGNSIVSKMIQSMELIRSSNENVAAMMTESNQKVSSILAMIENVGKKTQIINDIVFQTKLLSFNASVEAARAGEQGKGFAVVAEEIGVLAQNSGVAASEINQLLHDSLTSVTAIVEKTKESVAAVVSGAESAVREGTQVARDCGKVLEDIVKSSIRVSEMVSSISNANQESSHGVDEILRALHQLDHASHLNVNVADNCIRSSDGLSQQIVILREASTILSMFVDGVSNVSSFEWKEAYLLGITAMDDEHLVLVDKINHLAACFAGRPTEVKEAFQALASYAVEHFQHEEAYMKRIHYPEFDAHCEIHQKLLAQVSSLGEKALSKRAEPMELMTFLNDWLLKHILGTDMKYARFSKAPEKSAAVTRSRPS